MSVTGANLKNIEIEGGERILLEDLKKYLGRVCEKI